MTCNHIKTGYAGQRYCVFALDGDGEVIRIGWTNDSTGGGLVRAVNLHPVWHAPIVVDTRPVPTCPSCHTTLNGCDMPMCYRKLQRQIEG